MAAAADSNGADGRRYRNRKRSNVRVCGMCGVCWNDCNCPDDERTESIANILSSCRGMEETYSRHMNVFVYFSYRRWSAPYTEETFSAACFPSFEGWYSAWIRPAGTTARRVTGFEGIVLEVTVCFQDGTSMNGFITRSGELVVVNPAASPRHGVYLDPSVALLQMDAMPVARLLTVDEIVSGARGFVHGSLTGQNNGRRVSHIVGDDGGGNYLVLKYPQTDYHAVDLVPVPQQKLKDFVPQYAEEYRWRIRRRFTKAVANSMHPYLESFCERARATDIAHRAARSPVVKFDSVEKLVDDLVASLSMLKNAIENPKKKSGEEERGNVPGAKLGGPSGSA